MEGEVIVIGGESGEGERVEESHATEAEATAAVEIAQIQADESVAIAEIHAEESAPVESIISEHAANDEIYERSIDERLSTIEGKIDGITGLLSMVADAASEPAVEVEPEAEIMEEAPPEPDTPPKPSHPWFKSRGRD